MVRQDGAAEVCTVGVACTVGMARRSRSGEQWPGLLTGGSVPDPSPRLQHCEEKAPGMSGALEEKSNISVNPVTGGQMLRDPPFYEASEIV